MAEKIYTDFIIDFEALSIFANSNVVDLSALTFVDDYMNVPKFSDLIQQGITVKFDITKQPGRHRLPSTMNWWKTQDPEARIALRPSTNDVTLEDGIMKVYQYLKAQGVDYWKSRGWARGHTYDFPIFYNLLSLALGKDDVIDDDVVNFSRQRDIRTALECYIGRGHNTCPLPKGTLDGFIKHNSIHDSAKDVIMYLYAKRYAFGVEEPPKPEDADPLSLQQRP